MAELKEALKSGTIDEIKAKQQALTQAMDAVTKGMYSQQSAQPGPDTGAQQPGGTPPNDGGKKDDGDVIDADFTMK